MTSRSHKPESIRKRQLSLVVNEKAHLQKGEDKGERGEGWEGSELTKKR